MVRRSSTENGPTQAEFKMMKMKGYKKNISGFLWRFLLCTERNAIRNCVYVKLLTQERIKHREI
jgi:hypothetical protein